MKNKIILIGGYCATGKSAFSHKLAQELKVPCFNKDNIKETLGDGFGSESGDVYKKGSVTTLMIMRHIAERFLQTGQACILESNFVFEEIEDIKMLVEKYNGKILLFVLKGDLDVMFDRYINRDTERHWVHKPGGDRESFKNVMASYFGLEKSEVKQKITVDTTVFADVNYEDLFDTARRFLEN
jgi:2-phosphoglycerate kinase